MIITSHSNGPGKAICLVSVCMCSKTTTYEHSFNLDIFNAGLP